MEPRVHHNREVTLKLTVEVSDIAAAASADAPPSFNTRTIEATIRLKDGETNFLAGLIQDTQLTSSNKTPFLGDIPILGRLFTKDHNHAPPHGPHADDDAAHHPHPRHHRGRHGADVGRHAEQPELPRTLAAPRVAEHGRSVLAAQRAAVQRRQRRWRTATRFRPANMVVTPGSAPT